MFKSLAGPYRIGFLILFWSYLASILIGLLFPPVGLFFTFLIVITGISYLPQAYFTLRAGSAFWSRVSKDDSRLDLYVVVTVMLINLPYMLFFSIYGFDENFDNFRNLNLAEETVLGLIIIFVVVYLFSGFWVASKKLTYLQGVTPKFGSVFLRFLALGYWIFCFNWILKHTRLDGPAPETKSKFVKSLVPPKYDPKRPWMNEEYNRLKREGRLPKSDHP